jgi:DnaJ-domain-containing protein 1
MKELVGLPRRHFRCRLEELGPLSQLVYARYQKHRADFMDASTDFGDEFEKELAQSLDDFTALVPSRQRQLTTREETRRLNAAAKALREPLNRLEIQIGAAERAKLLTVPAKDMGLVTVRSEIQSRDMEGLDEALGDLIRLVTANEAALTAKGMKAQALQELREARQALGLQNTSQDGGRLDQVELTAENIKAGNAVWDKIAEILRVGRLLYKESDKLKAQSFTMARLKKLLRSPNEGGLDAPAAPQ